MATDRFICLVWNTPDITGYVKAKKIRRVSVFYYEEEGRLSLLNMKKLSELMHNLMHANYQITHNEECITLRFLCALKSSGMR